MAKPAFNERIQWSVNAHNRSKKTRLAVIHTQEGGGTAASLANYLCNPNAQVSYHWTVDNARNVVKVVNPTNLASWSVGNANDICINLCFAGSFASWSRKQWLDNMGNGIEIAAWILVDEAKRQGIDPRTIGWEEIGAGKSGFTDHWGITGGLKTGNHTDCGPNFPWDVYSEHVNRFATDGTALVADEKTRIELVREANEWLGVKLTEKREEPTPDGDGRFVHYEHGSIYYHPRLNEPKAFAVPLATRNKWESLGWETGFLGYPIGSRVDVVDFTKSDGTVVEGGVIQGFEGGTIYERRGDDSIGYVVQGTIFTLYRKMRYEMGLLGWPLSDELGWNGGKLQRFEHGNIIWVAETNTAVAVDSKGDPLPFPDAPTQPGPSQGDPNLVNKTLLDFSVDQIPAVKIKEAGHIGVIHYVSDPREKWMLAKPVTAWYATSLKQEGLLNVSNFQFGKGSTSDWRTGYTNGVKCAKRALELHKAAGGPDNAPIYASIDDNPSDNELKDLIKPYLQGWQDTIGKDRLGVYGNKKTIEYCNANGLGTYYWQHYWNGTGDRSISPIAHVTQERIDKDKVNGIGVDINVIRKPYFGQWQ